LPSEAWAEWLRLPAGFLEQIVEYRRYADMKFAVDRATTPTERARIRATPMGELAERIYLELAGEEISG